jgi:hypothetical protein
MEIKHIAFGDEGQVATGELMARLPAWRGRLAHLPDSLAPHLDRMRRGLETLQALERQHGGMGAIRLEGTAELVGAMLADLAHVEAAVSRAPGADGAPALLVETADFLLGVALWAVRHDVPLAPVEPVVNALAHRANAARTKQELAAVFGLTQGLLAHVTPALRADLERSNPERPWRVLHANLAITAIRTEDAALIDHAFDALDEALPDERAGFYAEALALALSPGIAVAVRERIAARHLKWTAARGMGENSRLI